MLCQLHWQFPDRTEMRAQKDIHGHPEMRAWFEDIKESHPLPEGAIWMVCTEKSKHFVLAAL